MNETNWNEAPSTDDLRRAYDEIPYLNPPKPHTHLSRIAAIGLLRGITPKSTTSCRVLELGCADGGNLLPMAFRFPETQFLGIDLSPIQIELGRKTIEALSLSNFELQAADILALRPEDLGRFDYIIVHGVYSWVPAEVQDRILSICRNCLSECGIAYISYNTYPGWRAKQALLEMLRYHTRNIVDLRKKVEAAFELLNILPQVNELPNDPAALLIQRLRHDLQHVENPATYLLHEYLVDVNEPIYFTEFLERIHAVGLQYIEDAYPGSAALDRLNDAAQAWARERLTKEAELQQYVDFIGNVSFRRSLICRDSIQLDRKVTFDRLKQLHATATCRSEPSETSVAKYKTDSGRSFTIEHAGLQAVLQRLVSARPESVEVVELRELLGESVGDIEAVEMVVGLLNGAALELMADANPCTNQVDELPFASRLVRHQAASHLVTNAAHRTGRIDHPLEQQLLPLLDGRHTLPQLTAMIREQITTDRSLNDDQWQELVYEHLSRLADNGLLDRAPVFA
ncbi:MAG: methyltransferase regulatory domain-containing protein [Pirellula sp.]